MAVKKSISEIPAKIRAKWDCVTYARDVLGLPVFKDGDRCTSLAPGPHTHSDALIVHDDFWHDFTWGKHGDVIDLCALVRHNGDKGEAMRELGAEFFSGFTPSAFHKHQATLSWLIDKWHSLLRPQDREYLHSRRITDETIDRLKLGYCPWEKSGMYDRIIIPYWKNGKPVYYAGRDCSGKWKDKSSGVSKYKKMWTGKNEFSENLMWGLHTHAKDWCRDKKKAKTLCILEGQFDVMSFEQDGWPVLSPIGGYFAKKLKPQIKSICKRFERVFICMDNDGPGVQFQRDMAEFLFSNQIPFICGHVPPDYNGVEIKDISDYYALGGSLDTLMEYATEGFIDLGESYKEGEETEFHDFIVKSGRYVSPAMLELLAAHVKFDKNFVCECLKEAKRAPLEADIAKEILSDHELLYMVNDGYYEYKHGVWSDTPFVAVQAMAREKLGRFATSSLMASVVRHVSVLKWCRDGFNKQNIINLLDGVLDLQTMELREHASTYLSTIQIPRVYDPKAKCPKMRAFVRDISNGDADTELLIQQMAGYFLYPDNRLNKAFFLMGDGANGKSVLIEILRYVIDPRNCSNVELSDMGDRFEPLRLRNSLVNFATETRVDLKGAEAAIKKVISGETISAAHKGVDAVEFTPRCKIVCACNNFVHSKDITHGFMRRIKIINFPKIFTEKTANPNLLEELKEEATGILNWMIEGWRLLQAMGHFVTSKDEATTREQFMVLANPLAGFIRECLMNVIGATTTSNDLYKLEYQQWVTDSGLTKMNKYTFGKVLSQLMRQMMPHVKQEVKRGVTVYTFPDKVHTADDNGLESWKAI